MQRLWHAAWVIDRRHFIASLAAGLAGCGAAKAPNAVASHRLLTASPRAQALIAAVRKQVGVTLAYDSSYTTLSFPMGDVPREKGVCTDVVIRGYREAFGADLQALVNADMRAHFAAYPRKWGLARPDRSIDHRRVPNLACFLARIGAKLPIPHDPKDWQPGDIFTSAPSNGQGGRATHIGIVTDTTGARSPMILHNIGRGAREEDSLLDWPITGRFRWQV